VIFSINKGIRTFDTMVAALHYHMYQHVILVNSGVFGGSAVQAPYRKDFEKLISHTHGGDQVTVNVFDIRLGDFDLGNSNDENKMPPAGIARLPLS
jgi:hypothetical protein